MWSTKSNADYPEAHRPVRLPTQSYPEPSYSSPRIDQRVNSLNDDIVMSGRQLDLDDPRRRGSLSDDVYIEDISHIFRSALLRTVSVSWENPEVAYLTSQFGYVFKTEDGGTTWDEYRIVIERKPYFNEDQQFLYLGIQRNALDRWGSRHLGSYQLGTSDFRHQSLGSASKVLFQRRDRIVGWSGIDVGAGGRVGAGENMDFGIGLPGRAPRLQNFIRKKEKKTAGLNIKQTLVERGMMNPMVRNLIIDPKDPKRLFACTYFGLYRSTDAGLNWVRVFIGINQKGYAVSQVAIDPSNTKHILAATAYGMFISEDGGDSFMETTAQGFGGVESSWIEFHPTDHRYVFVGTDYGVMRSADGGQNFDWIYFSTFPDARIVRYISISPHDLKRGYVATNDGLFWTENILTAGLEDWKRVGGLKFTGVETTKIDEDPSRPGHIWALTNLTVRSVVLKNKQDAGVHYIWESVDNGENWHIMFSGQTWSSMNWYASDPSDPSLLWMVPSRSLFRMKRYGADHRSLKPTPAQVQKSRDIIEAKSVPELSDVMQAMFLYLSLHPGQKIDYRQRSRLRAAIPRIDLAVSGFRTEDMGLQLHAFYPQLDPKIFATGDRTMIDYSVMASWNLSPAVFDLNSVLFGRMARAARHFRAYTVLAVQQLYGEYRRLNAKMTLHPPKGLRERMIYRMRLQELYSYLNFMTGNYLARYYERRDRLPGEAMPGWIESLPTNTDHGGRSFYGQYRR